MAGRRKEEDVIDGLTISTEESGVNEPKKTQTTNNSNGNNLINCLSNKKVIIRHIDRGNILGGNDPNHVISGGIANNATKVFCVPTNESGSYRPVLTKSEQEYLEDLMRLEHNTLSSQKVNGRDCFWDNVYVTLRKQDNYFDLSDPNQFINYKVLLANKDMICPSMSEYKRMPKATYQFVVINDEQDIEDKIDTITLKQKASILYGSIMDNFDKLVHIVSTMSGRVVSDSSTINFLKAKAYEYMENDRKAFISVVEDEFIDTKILIRKGMKSGYIAKRGDFYFLKDGNIPLCNSNEDPTITNACKFLNLPKNQEIIFNIEQSLR